jgi:hypothetical protein
MAASDEFASSRLIEVLGRIDTTLGTLDRRLQALEQSSQPPQPPALANPDNLESTKHEDFVATRKLSPDGSRQLQEIRFNGMSDVLTLLSLVASPCLDRHQDWQHTNPSNRIFTYPFTKLLSYRDILRFVIGESVPPRHHLRTLFSHETLTARVRTEAAELLDLFEEDFEPLTWRRDANADRGVILFDHLPSLFSPGMLLLGPGEEGLEQVVEVSSCDMVSTSATSEACVVEYWHFRWDGEGFSRTSGRFDLNCYSGTRPIKGFPYRSIIGPDLQQSITQLEQLLSRNRENLTLLKEISKVEIGDYPFCGWFSELSHGYHRGTRV